MREDRHVSIFSLVHIVPSSYRVSPVGLQQFLRYRHQAGS
jgi:hypothetical protein